MGLPSCEFANSQEKVVRASDRFEAMMTERRQRAEEEGLNPDVIERLYRDLVNYFLGQLLHRNTPFGV